MSTSLIVIIAIIAILALTVILIYNGLVSTKNQVENSWKQIDVQLKRRHDLIPNLVNAAKDYMQYEQETLTKVMEARAQAVGATDHKSAIAAEGALSGAMGKLFAVMENYPDLKSQQNVSQLMEELRSTENKIAYARQFYNDSVMSMNNKVQVFPSNIIANMLGFTKEEYFNMPEQERENPNVSLK